MTTTQTIRWMAPICLMAAIGMACMNGRAIVRTPGPATTAPAISPTDDTGLRHAKFAPPGTSTLLVATGPRARAPKPGETALASLHSLALNERTSLGDLADLREILVTAPVKCLSWGLCDVGRFTILEVDADLPSSLQLDLLKHSPSVAKRDAWEIYSLKKSREAPLFVTVASPRMLVCSSTLDCQLEVLKQVRGLAAGLDSFVTELSAHDRDALKVAPLWGVRFFRPGSPMREFDSAAKYLVVSTTAGNADLNLRYHSSRDGCVAFRRMFEELYEVPPALVAGDCCMSVTVDENLADGHTSGRHGLRSVDCYAVVLQLMGFMP